jgi:hypothetical protein
MRQHILKKPALDLGALEDEIRRRLQRGKTRLLISHLLCFILAVSVIFFVI